MFCIHHCRFSKERGRVPGAGASQSLLQVASTITRQSSWQKKQSIFLEGVGVTWAEAVEDSGQEGRLPRSLPLSSVTMAVAMEITPL